MYILYLSAKNGIDSDVGRTVVAPPPPLHNNAPLVCDDDAPSVWEKQPSSSCMTSSTIHPVTMDTDMSLTTVDARDAKISHVIKDLSILDTPTTAAKIIHVKDLSALDTSPTAPKISHVIKDLLPLDASPTAAKISHVIKDLSALDTSPTAATVLSGDACHRCTRSMVSDLYKMLLLDSFQIYNAAFCNHLRSIQLGLRHNYCKFFTFTH